MCVDININLQPYKYTGSFRFWCQKVLPLVYDDSLSYYELLCKVVNYLNDVIQNVDGLHADIETLLKSFNELQDFVNHYFTNLDVQAEIDNKLDKMVEDGTFDNIINNKIFTDLNNKIDENNQQLTDKLNQNTQELNNKISEQGETLNSFMQTHISFQGQQGWFVDISNDFVTQGIRKTTKPENLNPILIGENIVAYRGANREVPIDMPVDYATITQGVDSFYSSLINLKIKNNATVTYSHLFLDDDVLTTTYKLLDYVQIHGKRASVRTNPKFMPYQNAADIISVANSYYETVAAGRKWAYGNNFMTYSGSNIVNDGSGAGMMECDTFVAAVLAGIPYNLSPWATTTPNYTFNDSDLSYNPLNKPWCLPLKDGSAATLFGRRLTYTGALNWYFWYNAEVYSDKRNIATGDIIIFRDNKSDFFDRIAHIGLLSVENNETYIYDFSYYSIEHMRKMKLEDYWKISIYDESQAYYARPDYQNGM